MSHSIAARPSRRLSARLGIMALAVTQLLVLSIGGLWASARWIAMPLGGDQPYVLLVLGSDMGPPREGTALEGRADGFHVLVVAPDRQHVSILSFPRDTWVQIPGAGNHKINDALTYGPERAMATAASLTGLAIDDWIVTTFNGFMTGVDMLGGVEVDVEARLRDAASGTDFQPGPQTLSGPQALAYVRDRHSRAQGDLDRSESHARFLQAIHRKLFTEGVTPARLADLLSTLERTTDTSMSTARLFALGALAMQIPPQNVARVRLDAKVGTAGSASVVRLTDRARATMADLAENGLLEVLRQPAG